MKKATAMRAQEEIEQRILEMQETLSRLADDARNKRDQLEMRINDPRREPPRPHAR